MAETPTQEARLDELDIFVGEWIMTTSLASDPADAPRARSSPADESWIALGPGEAELVDYVVPRQLG